MKELLNITVEDIEKVSSLGTKESTQSTSSFDVKNYLNTRLSDGEKERFTTIRVISIDNENSTPFKEIFMHNVKVDTSIAPSGYKNYICLEKTKEDGISNFGKKCPFCELNREAYTLAEEAKKEGKIDLMKMYRKISLSNIPKSVAILRCIERDDNGIGSGPKFWKINIRQDKTDSYNTILNLFKLRKEKYRQSGYDKPINIFDIHEGLDLTLQFIETKVVQESNTITKTAITINTVAQPSPVSKDYNEMSEWIMDDKKWYEVFPPKPYEYLSLIKEGKQPWFDNEKQLWVDKDILLKDKDESINNVIEKENNIIESLSDNYKANIVNDINDDLPF